MTSKLRTFLAVLGILVGTASVVAMVSGGKLATRQALAQFKSLGTNLLSVQVNQAQSGSGSASSKVKLTLQQADGIKTISPAIQQVAPYTSLYVPITYHGHTLNGSILGVTHSMAPVMKIKIAKGRFISFLDRFEKFCVIGQSMAQSMKQYTVKSLIGQQIDLHGNFFTIIGIAKKWTPNSFLYADVNQSLLIPIQVSNQLSKYAQINSIIFRLGKGVDLKGLQAAITNYFNENVPGKQLYFQSAQQLIQSMQKQQSILTVFLGFIGSISLLVGGIGVMNIMLVSVTERKREIGIRLAIGAKRRDIRLMFLIESVMLSLFGGIVGVLLGILISFIIADFKGWAFTVFWLPPTIGFVVSMFTGVFFGFYPAYKASKLDPIETLRTD
jgi:putative ABC transport system permease protein